MEDQELCIGLARKFDSQALEADGLHFRADMFSSAIVVAGLLVVFLFGIPNADAYAALGVASRNLVCITWIRKKNVRCVIG